MNQARDTAAHLAGQARDAAANLTDKARDAASNLTDKARDLAGNVSDRASPLASEVSRRAGDAVSSVSGQMQNLAGTLRENAPREGTMGSAATAVADTLESGATYLQEQGLGDVASELESVIRRYPIPSVLVGFGMGFLLARTFRS